MKRKELKYADIKEVVYTFVVADLFHYGHLQLLQTAKNLGDYHICGVLTDEAAQTYRPRPITNLDERLAVVSSLTCIDRVVIQKSKDPTENLRRIHDEFKNARLVLVHGNDWNDIPGRKYVEEIGGEVIQPAYYRRLEESKIRKEISKPDRLYYEFYNEHFKIDNVIFYSPKHKQFTISTKANTLKALQPLIRRSRIEKSFVFRVQNWIEDADGVLRQIQKEFDGHIVVRSSAIVEDTFHSSRAGYYHSEIGVPASNKRKIREAIKRVIGSYENDENTHRQNQVLVQSQTSQVKRSGVVFTRKMDSGAPYYTINYDDKTGSTVSVTGGLVSSVIEIVNFCKRANCPARWQGLISAVKEIEKIIPKLPLDIEFAINAKQEIIIYQVRPLVVNNGKHVTDEKVFRNTLDQMKAKFKKLTAPVPHLAGTTTYFSDMAFWNPAEIIGDRPNYLDYSLYEYIITEKIWHEALSSLGYKNVDPVPLMVQFAGKPYIDIRGAFNSLLPGNLDREICEKLLAYYMGVLKSKPELHDKIEFEIVNTCFDFSLDRRLKKLLSHRLTANEINKYRAALVELTGNILKNFRKITAMDLQAANIMEGERRRIEEKTAGSPSFNELIGSAFKLLDECKIHGTLPFSRLARMAFIGKSFLHTLMEKGYISADFHDRFMDSLNTVAKTMSRDCASLARGEIPKDNFINKYGHLRPGTYDITSPRYVSTPELFDEVQRKTIPQEENDFEEVLRNNTIFESVENALKAEDIKISCRDLFEFIKQAFEGREYLKFEFSKNLSTALEYIASAGEHLGFSREEMAYLNVSNLKEIRPKKKDSAQRYLAKIIEKRKRERSLYQSMSLPPLIFSEKDFEVIKYYRARPNYITRKCIQGPIFKLDGRLRSNSHELSGKIVLVEKADPGYDWIFTKNIAALITRFGGVASHMAIRCAESGIPAAIGCGDVIYKDLLKAKNIYLNCSRGEIKSLN